MVAVEGGKMRLLTYLELSRYSKPELWELLRQVLALLDAMPESSSERETATLNIQNIRLFLRRPDFTPS